MIQHVYDRFFQFYHQMVSVDESFRKPMNRIAKKMIARKPETGLFYMPFLF